MTTTTPPPVIPPEDEHPQPIEGYDLVILAADRTPLCGWTTDEQLVVWATAEELAVALRRFIMDNQHQLGWCRG